MSTLPVRVSAGASAWATTVARRDGREALVPRQPAVGAESVAFGRAAVLFERAPRQGAPAAPTVVVFAVDVDSVIYEDVDLRHTAPGAARVPGGGAALVLGDPYAPPLAADRGALVDRYV